MLRMRVKLATQIFSNSVAKESASAWLDSWEQQVVSGEIHKDLFLTQSTAEGLRVTLKSVRELSIYLLKDCDFKYVLTAKMNQDPLERFFGIIRQAGGQNEHPTFPTFLQLYRMLSLYSLVKPPKFGNCTLPDKRQAAVVTLSDIREIYKGSAAQRTGKLDELKRKLDGLIDEGSWECDDVFDFDDPDTDATVVECIVYYVTGFVSRKLRNGTTCSICKNALQGKQGLASVPEADLVNCKTRGWLTHPNMHLFDFFKYTEEQFAKYAGDRDAYDKTTDAVLENFHFTFPCGTHKEEMLAKLLHYYICLRMRQYSITGSLDSVPTGCALAISDDSAALADWVGPTTPPVADKSSRQWCPVLGLLRPSPSFLSSPHFRRLLSLRLALSFLSLYLFTF
ncbi:hypothetical protein HPB51_017929 [Rhipicephalus microplus]|uniref:Transposable element P transposase-like RNase H C-terminal domain-containing protein n=1 Tax=Rhipicephalus microplus TaxID=6941 RepID=A0A9J6EP09_RHIMP|nr:hypothetical protein HPB51_017929 [Rhipicephalus microplus]